MYPNTSYHLHVLTFLHLAFMFVAAEASKDGASVAFCRQNTSDIMYIQHTQSLFAEIIKFSKDTRRRNE